MRECKTQSNHREESLSRVGGVSLGAVQRVYAKLLMDHFEKMATAEYLERRMKELDQFHDGLSTGDAEATKMRELRRREGVKVSPSSEPERRRKERDDDQGRHEGKRRKVDEGRDKGPSRKQDDRRTQGEGRRRSRSRSTKRRREEGPTTSRRRASDSRRDSVRKEDEKETADLRWKPGSGKYGMLRESQKKEQKLDQQDFVGGGGGASNTPEPGAQDIGSVGTTLWSVSADHQSGRDLRLAGLRHGEEVGRPMERGAAQVDGREGGIDSEAERKMVVSITTGWELVRSLGTPSP